MFQVDLGNGEVYKVKFRYDLEKKETMCVASFGSMSCVGIVRCYYKDQYIRKEGRKRAFAAAIECLDREERTKFWEEYKKVCKL